MASSADVLAGRSALVTGASRGIGLAVAHALAGAGARVVLNARGGPDLERAAAATRGVAVRGDVGSVAGVARLGEDVRAALGGDPQIVVNAAGAFLLAPIAQTEPEAFERILAVNLLGPFLLMRAFLPGMLARGSGHVVTVGSVAGRRAFAENGAYSASKFGVRGLHAVLAEELKGTGVRCTLVEPAATDTPLWDEVDRAAHPGLPRPEDMMDAAAVASAVLYAVTRPDTVAMRNLMLERA